MIDQKCGFPRGKGLGGTSIINYMIYNRGNKRDFDGWAAAGNTGWSWREVLPYFLKSEHSTLENLSASPFHNPKGLLNVEYNRKRTVLAEAFIEGNKFMGQPEVDYNSGDQLGVSYLQGNTIRGQRETAFRAFLKPILFRTNLHIMSNTRATKVLIDARSKTAYGVEFARNGKRFVNARKEVILSAGAFHSPQLLMLSGIGDANDLARINVPLIQNLPVGKQMFDHISHFGPTFIVNTSGVSLNTDRILTVEQIASYARGRGDLTVPGGVEALGFLKTANGNHNAPDIPDVELIFTPGGLHSDQGAGIRRGMRITDQIYDTVYKPLEPTSIDTWSVMVMLFHPKSVGYMTLQSNNPFDNPIFYPNFLQKPEDVENLLDGIKYAVKLSTTPAFQRFGSRLNDIPIPGCAHLHFGSDDYWRCSIRTLSCTLHHQVSTCKMGPSSDPMAVVSPELKVHGIRNLRVADCSIIPEAPTSHTNAASLMIGEKVADLIKQQWQNFK